MTKMEWRKYWDEVEQNCTPEVIEEPGRAAREVQAEIRTVTFMILHHKREIARLTGDLNRLENGLDGIYWRQERGEAVAK